jgi:hypothetical protein
VPVVQAAEAEPKEPLVVASVEIAECSRIACLTPLHQRSISIEVDVVAEAGQFFFTERQLNPYLPLRLSSHTQE